MDAVNAGRLIAGGLFVAGGLIGLAFVAVALNEPSPRPQIDRRWVLGCGAALALGVAILTL